MCIMGCGKNKFRNTPLVNNPVYICNIYLYVPHVQPLTCLCLHSTLIRSSSDLASV
ncbi:unnamed protein product [Tenebrio molitor]|nr:unnamed protein product [Tenebrio molitor]